jgi:hypothetical protein
VHGPDAAVIFYHLDQFQHPNYPSVSGAASNPRPASFW